MAPSYSFRSIPFIFISFLSCLIPSAAQAQGAEPERLSIGVAAGVANPWHGDFDFTAMSWQADVRFRTGRFFASNVFYEQWRHGEEDVRTGISLIGPGPIGQIDRIVTNTERRTSVLGWNLLVLGQAGRATISGGGGISYLQHSREYSQTLSGCPAGVTCGTFSDDFNSNSFAAQFQAGVDVRLAPHVAAMGQFRMVIPIEDPGFGHHTVVGGARFFW